MPVGRYKAANREATALKLAEEHIAHKDTCNEVRNLVRGTLLERNIEKILTLSDIMSIIPKIKFRLYHEEGHY